MKNLKTVLGTILIASAILTGCGNSSDNLDLSNLKTPCDHIDAIQMVFDDVIKLRNKNEGTHWDDLGGETRLEFQALMDKIMEIDEIGSNNNYVITDYKNCDKYLSLKESRDNLPMYFIAKTEQTNKKGIWDSF
jgi:hypothetical protein